MADSPGTVRAALTAPVLDTPTKPIRFLHSGYDAPNNVLFRLARVDTVAGQPTIWGVCHLMALVACQVVANNAWSGYLSIDKQGHQMVTTPLDGVLVSEEYYFLVNGKQSRGLKDDI